MDPVALVVAHDKAVHSEPTVRRHRYSSVKADEKRNAVFEADWTAARKTTRRRQQNEGDDDKRAEHQRHHCGEAASMPADPVVRVNPSQRRQRPSQLRVVDPGAGEAIEASMVCPYACLRITMWL